MLDVVRPATGLAVDAASGTLPELNLLEQFRDDKVVAARDAFADGQVTRREHAPPADVVDEWTAAEWRLCGALRVDPAAAHPLPFGFDVVLVTDLCVHADDVAGALGLPPLNRDTAAARVALSGYSFGLDYRIRALGLPGLALRMGDRERVLGESPATTSVAADSWELLRVLAGRRSRSQILDLEWSGDPSPYVALLPAYGERADALTEG